MTHSLIQLMLCVLIFMHEWWNLQFKVDPEAQIFKKLFMAGGNILFYIFVLITGLGFASRHHIQ